MTTELLRLEGSAHDLRAAAALCRTRHLHLRLGPPSAEPEGFVRGVPAVDLWTMTSAPAPGPAWRAASRWLDAGATFALFDVASFGADRLVESVYFPLFVRHSYCTGGSPFPMNADTFARLATPDLLLTVATLGGREVAACLFQPSRRTPAALYSAPELASCGLDVAASAVEDPRLSDAFFYASLRMLEAHGFSAVRVRNSPWVTPRDAPRWRRDLARAGRAAWEERSPADYFFWQEAAFSPGEGVLSFYAAGGRVFVRALGEQTGAMRACRRRLDGLLGAPAGGPA